MSKFELITWPVVSGSRSERQGKWHILEETQPTTLCQRVIPAGEVFTVSDEGWDPEETCQLCTEVYLHQTLVDT